MPDKRKIHTVKTFAIYGMMYIIIAVYSVFIYRYVSMQIDDNVRINMAGRLRMMTQKITKDMLLYRDRTVERRRIDDDLHYFHKSMIAVLDGGMVHEGIDRKKMVPLSPMDDRKSRELLETALRQWEPFMDQVKLYLDLRQDRSLKYILDHNEILLNAIDRAVVSITAHSDDDGRTLGAVIASAVVLVIGGAVAAFIGQMKRLRSASRRLSEMELLLPICSNCKKIRTDSAHPDADASWTSIEIYLKENKEMLFTHGICPECSRKLYPEYFGDDKK